MVAVLGGATFAVLALPHAVPSTTSGRGAWLGLAVFGFFTLAAVWSAVAAWHSTRFLRVPPQTEIARACDFSDDLGNIVLGERRVWAIRAAAFAEAFAAANRARLRTDADRRREARLRAVWAILLLGSLLAAALLLGTI